MRVPGRAPRTSLGPAISRPGHGGVRRPACPFGGLKWRQHASTVPAHGHPTDTGWPSALGHFGGRNDPHRVFTPARRLSVRLAWRPFHPGGGQGARWRRAERAVLATVRRALPHRPVPRSRERRMLRGRDAGGRRLDQPAVGRPTPQGRRILVRGNASGRLAESRRVGARARGIGGRFGRIPRGAGAEMASGRTRLLPSGRKQKRRRAPLCLHGDLCIRFRRGGAVETLALAQGAGAVRRSR